MKNRRRIKGTIAGMLSLLATTPLFAGDGWATVQPACNLDTETATVRVEGGTKLPLDLSLYGFADIDATSEKPLDFESLYGELRLERKLGKEFAVAAEYNGGTGTEDTVRGGVTFTPTLGEGNFTIFKAFPLDTAGKGPQVSVYTKQQFPNGISGSLLLDYNLDPKAFYAEMRIKKELNNLLSFYGEARCSGTLSEMDCSPVVGLEVKVK